jgi:hypothetical protein
MTNGSAGSYGFYIDPFYKQDTPEGVDRGVVGALVA